MDQELVRQEERTLLSRICTRAAELAGLNLEAPKALEDAHKLLTALEELHGDIGWLQWEKQGRRDAP